LFFHKVKKSDSQGLGRTGSRTNYARTGIRSANTKVSPKSIGTMQFQRRICQLYSPMPVCQPVRNCSQHRCKRCLSNIGVTASLSGTAECHR
jgi:hypothetical protein